MDMITVNDSQAIAGYGYDLDKGHMRFQTTDGKFHDYFDVPPEIFDALQKSGSKGKAFNEIRGKFAPRRTGGRKVK